MPFSLNDGDRIFPEGVKGAANFMASRPLLEFRAFRKNETSELRPMVATLRAELGAIRNQHAEERFETSGKMNVTFLRRTTRRVGGERSSLGEPVRIRIPKD